MTENEKIEALAMKIYEMGCTKIMVNCRFFANAVNRSRVISYPLTIANDGECVYMNPVFFVKQYKIDPARCTRAVFHMTMHCVFLHMFVSESVDQRLWNLACDIVVENAVNELNLDFLDIKLTEKQNAVVAKLKHDLKEFTAEYVYKYFLLKELDEEYIRKLEVLFGMDEHSVWYNFAGEKYKNPEDYENGGYVLSETVIEDTTNQPQNANYTEIDSVKIAQQGQDDQSQNKDDEQGQEQSGENDQQGQDGQPQNKGDGQGQNQSGQNEQQGQDQSQNKGDQQGQDDQSQNKGDQQGQDQSQNKGDQQGQNQADQNGQAGQKTSQSQFGTESGHKTMLYEMLVREKEGMRAEWKRVSLQVKVEMETFCAKQGKNAGSLMQSLQAVTRENYSYEEFLRKFAVTTEEMKINQDEFDYIFYTYGLKNYKNMPLIEELEYKDSKQIKEFAIIIDTSGSVKGELVQRFLQKTYNILKETSSFAKKVCIHIIQCDTQVHKDTKIESLKDLEKYFINMKLYGFGGTDFRPAFKYVEKLQKEGEFTNLKGLLYFTDGYGEFPTKPTKYKTAFVFIEGEQNNYADVPPWAITLKLDKLDLV